MSTPSSDSVRATLSSLSLRPNGQSQLNIEDVSLYFPCLPCLPCLPGPCGPCPRVPFGLCPNHGGGMTNTSASMSPVTDRKTSLRVTLKVPVIEPIVASRLSLSAVRSDGMSRVSAWSESEVKVISLRRVIFTWVGAETDNSVDGATFKWILCELADF